MLSQFTTYNFSPSVISKFTTLKIHHEPLYVVLKHSNSFLYTLEHILEYNIVFKRNPARLDTGGVPTKQKMKCIYCDSEDTRVVETRQAGDDLRRRRECPNCQQRFTTYERVDQQPVRIIKKNGNRELYDRNKLRQGIIRACEKRPVTEQEITSALDHIETVIRKAGNPEIQSAFLGDLTMDRLKMLDQVAYIRFASVYKDFTDIDSFKKEIKVLTRGN